ncbi:MAG: hypothetical protein P9L92_05265 [Candidatus Electryonea clarkiae]|nr:hypothetical protein [Candidatus Electryonea clarkiae]MDP8286908.1 hypothetical protein [Candidatus Electryonea clarkiae]
MSVCFLFRQELKFPSQLLKSTTSLLIPGCFSIFLLAGCEDLGTGTDGADSRVASIELVSDETSISGFINQRNFIEMIAVVKDTNGTGILGIGVDFSIIDGSGRIIRADSITDESGKIRAFYFFRITTEEPQTARIKAAVPHSGISDLISIPITAKDLVISLTADRHEVIVPRGEPGRINFTARTSDISGVGIADMPISIVAIEGRGDLFEDTTFITGSNGSASFSIKIDSVMSTEEFLVRAYLETPSHKEVFRNGENNENHSLDNKIIKQDEFRPDYASTIPCLGRSIQSTLSDTVHVMFIPAEEAVDSLLLYIYEWDMTIPEDSVANKHIAEARCYIYDKNHVSLPDIQVNFSLEDISKTNPTPTGLIIPVNTTTAYIYQDGQYGVWYVIAAVGEAADTVIIEVDTIRVSGTFGGTLKNNN